MIALQPVRWTMWYRNRTVLSLIAVYMAIACTVLFTTNVAKLPGLVIAAILIVGIFASLILLGVFIHQDAEVGTKGSSFPVYLFSLPVSTAQLVFVPMGLGSGLFLGIGLLLSWAARHGGASTPLLWPAFMVAAFLAMLQAIFWYPIGFAYSKLILTLIGVPLIATYVGASLTEGVSEAAVCRGLMMFIVLMYALAYHGVSRARRGEGQLVRISKPESVASRTKDVKWLKPFQSAAAAQRWYEWRQHGIVLPALTLFLFVLFCLPLSLHDTYSPIWILGSSNSPIVPTIPTYVATYLPTMLGLIPMMAWIIGCGARRSDVKLSDRTFQLFFGVRPMSDGSMVAQKLWAALKSTAVAYGIFLLACIYLLQLKGGHFDPKIGYVREDAMPIYSVLRPYLSSSVLLYAAAGLFLLVATTWRNYAVGLWVDLSGIRWLTIGYPLSVVFALIITWAGLSGMPRQMQFEWLTLPKFSILVGTIVVVKLILAAFLALKAIGSGAVSKQTLARGLCIYALVGAVVTAIVLKLVGPVFEEIARHVPDQVSLAQWLTVGLVVIYVPMVRILLAPMMLNRNRHRAN